MKIHLNIRPSYWCYPLLLLLIGCQAAPIDSGGKTVCTLEAIAGITIYTYDQATGLPVCGGTATIIDADFSETLIGPEVTECAYPYNGLAGVWERAGNYQVSVSLPGYTTWTNDAVVVTENVCHVNPIKLDVYLTPM